METQFNPSTLRSNTAKNKREHYGQRYYDNWILLRVKVYAAVTMLNRFNRTEYWIWFALVNGIKPKIGLRTALRRCWCGARVANRCGRRRRSATPPSDRALRRCRSRVSPWFMITNPLHFPSRPNGGRQRIIFFFRNWPQRKQNWTKSSPPKAKRTNTNVRQFDRIHWSQVSAHQSNRNKLINDGIWSEETWPFIQYGPHSRTR